MKKTTKMPTRLKKYTKLYHLESILAERKLHLGDPASWPDKNDTFCLEQYVELKGLSAVRVACLNGGADRYHFWHVYGGCTDGVCLWFDRTALINDINTDDTLSSRFVIYKSISGARGVSKTDVPFTKRSQYSDEKEYRVLREIPNGSPADDKFAFKPSSLESVYLNPWMSLVEVAGWKRQISKWLGGDFSHVKICQNRSLSNDKWKTAISEVLAGKQTT